MKKKILLFMGLFMVLTIATSANAGWKRYPHLQGVQDFKLNDKVVARYLGIPQYPQPTSYTCGATTISMLMLWESHKEGKALKFSPMSIHNYVSSKDPKGKTSGLTTTELKAGVKKLAGYVNEKLELPVNMIMNEDSYSSIAYSILAIKDAMMRNFSPAILYGNVNIPSIRKGYQVSPGARPGGHYYLVTGAVACPKSLCGESVWGLFLNDSVYNSRAWNSNSTIRKVAVTPRKLILEIDLKKYWLPTGDKIPWKRGHMFLYNTKSKA